MSADGHMYKPGCCAPVDYLPTVNPDNPRPAAEQTMATLTRLLLAARADALADRDRARGEHGLLAPAGSAVAARVEAHETYWRALHPGLAGLIDWTASPP